MPSDPQPILPPSSGVIAMRIGLEFGPPDEFAHNLDHALAKGGERGATLTALLDRGDMTIHIPREDGPCWNAVPLVHVHRGQPPSDDDWATANAILEKLERYR